MGFALVAASGCASLVVLLKLLVAAPLAAEHRLEGSRASGAAVPGL